MNVQAELKYLRVSPRKMDLLAKAIKFMDPTEAINHLEFINKNGARQLRQLIMSCVDNAKQKNLNINKLKFVSIEILPGTAIKRFIPVARGMAHEYKKRMSHLRVILTEKNDIKPITEIKSKIDIKHKDLKS